MNVKDQIATARALAKAAEVANHSPPAIAMLLRGTVTSEGPAALTDLATLLERACEFIGHEIERCDCHLRDGKCDHCDRARAFLAGEVKP